MLKKEVFVFVFIDAFDEDWQTGEEGWLVLLLFFVHGGFSEDLVEVFKLFGIDIDDPSSCIVHLFLFDFIVEMIIVSNNCIFLFLLQGF